MSGTLVALSDVCTSNSTFGGFHDSSHNGCKFSADLKLPLHRQCRGAFRDVITFQILRGSNLGSTEAGERRRGQEAGKRKAGEEAVAKFKVDKYILLLLLRDPGNHINLHIILSTSLAIHVVIPFPSVEVQHSLPLQPALSVYDAIFHRSVPILSVSWDPEVNPQWRFAPNARWTNEVWIH